MYETPDGRLDVFSTELSNGVRRYIIMDHKRRVAYNFEDPRDAGMAWGLSKDVPDLLETLAGPGYPQVYEAVRTSDLYNEDYDRRAAARATREATEAKD